MQEISAASNEQNSRAGQIDGALQQLQKVIQQNASAAEEMAATSEERSGQAARLFSTIDFFGTGSRECRTRIGRRVSGVCRRPSEARRRAAARRPTVSRCPGRADRSVGSRVRAILAGCSRRSTIITEPRLSGSGCLRPSTPLRSRLLASIHKCYRAVTVRERLLAALHSLTVAAAASIHKCYRAATARERLRAALHSSRSWLPRRSTNVTGPRLSGSGCLRPSTSPRSWLGKKARERGTYRVRLTNKYDVARRRSIPTAPQPN